MEAKYKIAMIFKENEALTGLKAACIIVWQKWVLVDNVTLANKWIHVDLKFVVLNKKFLDWWV